MTSSATAIIFTFGINEDLYRYIAVGLLVTIGLIVSLLPVIYQSIEKIEMVLCQRHPDLSGVRYIYSYRGLCVGGHDHQSTPRPGGLPRDLEHGRGPPHYWVR